jgi:GTP cyclohydrolase IA
MLDRKRAEKALNDFLLALGRDPAKHPEHAETAKLVTQAFEEDFCKGYSLDPAAVLKRETIALTGTPSLILVRDIQVRSMCPHHLLPSLGTATLAVMPKKHIAGLGAYVAVVRAYAQRLTLQEDLGANIVETLAKVLKPVYVGCVLDLQHACLSGRGECEAQARVQTVHTYNVDHSAFLATVRA